MINEAIKFDRKHIFLSNGNHAALGFGLALVLQHYIVGNAFLPVWLGWILVAFGLIAHIYAFTRKN